MRGLSTDDLDGQMTPVSPSTEPRQNRAVVFVAFIIAILCNNRGMKTVIHLSSLLYAVDVWSLTGKKLTSGLLYILNVVSQMDRGEYTI